ncbi:ethylbenzene dehydrogenase-related protein [Halorubrum lipolyticum]|uniref:DMSO reductase family type II enzyme, heme b subunit n=1 Tax=Halorubrum lipolyticum DSM 21995 TaxID=1227482 RepID=M0P157_9EURY|nr:ethylbenzene dehydrogenase-related protein [Halorubrum lipolyticum]EMA63892.1 DMSO reductase family type II enzyme, heme b subunit [Halorubrum lipolyticum DSM 21995]
MTADAGRGDADRSDAEAGGGLGSRELAAAAAIALAVVLATAAFPMLVDARAAYEIPVERQAGAGDLAEPTGDAWESVETVSVPLSSSGAAVPGGSDATVDSAGVAAARTDERLYLRLSWDDGTANTSTDSLRAFADAAAVQLPVSTEKQPPIAMGSADDRVNVWYWNGADGTESLLAGGAGSTTRLPESAVEATATHTGDRWAVVFSRSLASDRANVTDVDDGEDVNAAFAVWEGSNDERSGQKAASEWYYLSLGPDDGGAPYETVLWAIAGAAVVFTTLVTVEGVRRTRGE